MPSILIGGSLNSNRTPLAVAIQTRLRQRSDRGGHQVLFEQTHPEYTANYPMTFIQVAALAQRLANPTAKASELQIPDPGCLKSGKLYLRNVIASDFSPEGLTLAKLAAYGRPLPSSLVIDSFGTMYDRLTTELLVSTFPDQNDRALEIARIVASDAAGRTVWDLTQADLMTILVTWDTEVKVGKGLSVQPHAPKGAMNSVDLWLTVRPDDTVIVGNCRWEALGPGTEVHPLRGEWGWFDSWYDQLGGLSGNKQDRHLSRQSV